MKKLFNVYASKPPFDTNKLESEIRNASRSFLENLGYPEDYINDYFNVDISIDAKNGDDTTYLVEVRAELDYDELFDLGENLNHIVEDYDSNAYFDVEEPGIITAYVRNINTEKQ